MDGRPNQRNKAAFFKFLRFEERFQKLRFRDGLVWTVGLTREIKLRFSNSSGLKSVFKSSVFVTD